MVSWRAIKNAQFKAALLAFYQERPHSETAAPRVSVIHMVSNKQRFTQ